MISEKENVLRIYSGEGEPEFVPNSMECYYTIMPFYLGGRPIPPNDGTDGFGVFWVWDDETKGYTADPRKPVMIEDITQWREKLILPDLAKIDFHAMAKKDLEGKDRDAKAVRLFLESGPFERLHALVGFEQAFIDMYDEPEAFLELMDALTSHREREIELLAEAYQPDIILCMDDLASADAPLFSKSMYDEFIKPFEVRIAKKIHEAGAYYCYHSCGRMQTFLDDLIEMGVDCVNAMTPCNDQADVMKKYGAAIAVDGGMNSLLINDKNVTEEELREEVRRVIDIFAPYKRFVLHPATFYPEKREILIDECHKYGGTYYKTK